MFIRSKLSRTILPLLDRVLVQRIKPAERTKAGVLIPEKAQEALPEGQVLAVGPGAWDKEGQRVAMTLAVGDRVLLPVYGGSNVKVDDEELLLFRESEILAKIEQ